MFYCVERMGAQRVNITISVTVQIIFVKVGGFSLCLKCLVVIFELLVY